MKPGATSSSIPRYVYRLFRPFVHLIYTFRGRLALLYMAVEFSLLLFTGILLYAVLSHQISVSVDQQLKQQATTVVRELETSKFHFWNQEMAKFSRHFLGTVQLVGTNGILLFSSDRELIGRGGSEVTEALQDAVTGHTSFVSTRSLLRKDNVRVVAMPVHRAGFVVAIVLLGRSTREIHSFFELMYLIGGLLGLISMLVSAYAGYVMARRALQPMDEIGAVAMSFAAGDLSKRLELSTPDREIRYLMRTLNKMFADLEASIQAQKRFTADASHELRIPLTILRGEIEVALLRKRRPREYEEMLRQQLEVIDRMQRIVDGLLTLARADAGLLELARDEIDLSLLLQEVGQQHLTLFAGKNVQLDIEIADGLLVIGDQDRLSRVAFNLLNNAYKHAPPGTRVRLMAEAQGDEAIITVADKGPGIAPEHVEHIFDRFYRSDEARDRETGGAGLGLAISKRIAEAHGGSIEVESMLGEGTLFRFRLPLAGANPTLATRLEHVTSLTKNEVDPKNGTVG